jgi:hypothetical protein
MISIQIDENTAKALTTIANARHTTVAEYLRSLVANELALLEVNATGEFDQELEPLLFDGPPLPADFSRADIYADHD